MMKIEITMMKMMKVMSLGFWMMSLVIEFFVFLVRAIVGGVWLLKWDDCLYFCTSSFSERESVSVVVHRSNER